MTCSKGGIYIAGADIFVISSQNELWDRKYLRQDYSCFVNKFCYLACHPTPSGPYLTIHPLWPIIYPTLRYLVPLLFPSLVTINIPYFINDMISTAKTNPSLTMDKFEPCCESTTIWIYFTSSSLNTSPWFKFSKPIRCFVFSSKVILEACLILSWDWYSILTVLEFIDRSLLVCCAYHCEKKSEFRCLQHDSIVSKPNKQTKETMNCICYNWKNLSLNFDAYNTIIYCRPNRTELRFPCIMVFVAFNRIGRL